MDKSIISIENFNLWYGKTHILKDINLNFYKNRINCIIGPSGGGKSSLIRTLNRIDYTTNYNGKILFHNENILQRRDNLPELRKKIGMVFQKACVFPKSIAENVLFGLSNHKKLTKDEKDEIIKDSLIKASLWDELKDRLNDDAQDSSLGQQQRLCIARTLTMKPEVIIFDEPTSSVDPISTRKIESLMFNLKENYTIIIVTHDIEQAKRIADATTFLCNGEVIEHSLGSSIFTTPQKKLTNDYVNFNFCEC